MSSDQNTPTKIASVEIGTEVGDQARRLTPAAERALAEAAERRKQREADAANHPKELGGREGPDPVRYGDWENGGIASDF